MQPISEHVEKLYSRMDVAMGVDDDRPIQCEKHGEQNEVHYSGHGRIQTPGWSGCPLCRDDRLKDEAKREAEEFERQRLQRLVDNFVHSSGIPPRFRKKSFDNFEAVNQKSASHLKKVREYAETVSQKDHGGRCLLMLGKVGNGKTHLACALLEHVIRETGQPGFYWTFSEFVRYVKASFVKGAGHSEEDAYKDFAKGRLVVLDEVGMQNFTEFEQAVAYEAINARYLSEKPTVLISNLQAKDLPACVGERVVDRLREGGGKALDFDWKSYRQGGAS